MYPIHTKGFAAGAVVRGSRIVMMAAGADTVNETTAGTQAAIGVSDAMGAAAIGQMCDVHLMGVGEVRAGGNVTRGAFCVSDAEGRGVVPPAPGAQAVTLRTVGVFLAAGAEGDLVPVLLGLGQITVPAA